MLFTENFILKKKFPTLFLYITEFLFVIGIEYKNQYFYKISKFSEQIRPPYITLLLTLGSTEEYK